MPRSLWTGSLSFGLVNIPVKLYNAVSPKDIRFHLLHDEDGARIQQKRVCSVDGEEVTSEHLVKGFEISPDHYVKITKEELEHIDPKATHTIDIQDFVSLSEIDPLYFEHSYYVAPGNNAANAYGLLLNAMRQAQKVAIAKVVMRTKQYLCAIRPQERALVMSTLYFADEIVAQTALPEIGDVKTNVDDRQLAMAQQLIDSLTTDFDPKRYHDEYRERVLELIEKKAEGEEVVQPPQGREPAKVINLMDALEASLAAAKRTPAAAKKPAPARKGSSHAAAERPKRKRKA